MLNENDIDFEYREYTERPLSTAEIKVALIALGKSARDVLRPRDAKKFEISEALSDADLIKKMAAHPTLLQRPILLKRQDDKVTGAALGRPVEDLSALFTQ